MSAAAIGQHAGTKKEATREGGFFDMARPEGFEPPTPKFVAWCSIQLSYGRVRRGIMTAVSDVVNAFIASISSS